MDERRMRDGIAVIAAIVIVALMGLTLLVSCTAKEIITEETSYVHDTVEVHRVDTLWEYKLVSQRDTVKQETVHTVVLNERGDTIKEIHHYHDTEKIIIVDSTYKYESERDSLRKALDQAHEREKTKEKRGRTWTDTIAAIVVLLACVAFFYFIWRLEKKDGNNKGEE